MTSSLDLTTTFFVPDNTHNFQIKLPMAPGRNHKINITVGQGAQVYIADYLQGDQEVSRAIQCVLHPYARVTFVHNQRLDEHVQDNNVIEFSLHQSSILEAKIMKSGALSSKQVFKIIMLGEEAQASITGGYILAGQQQLNISCEQLHMVQKTTSHVMLKGALAGTSVVHYQGKIVIAADARKSDASQENKNILLSESAKAVSIPNLEALNNEVQCAHGSAVGHLDAEQLWAMQAKGIDEARAKKLLLEGFFADIVSADVNINTLLEKVV